LRGSLLHFLLLQGRCLIASQVAGTRPDAAGRLHLKIQVRTGPALSTWWLACRVAGTIS
jgi:hypothetical protein